MRWACSRVAQRVDRAVAQCGAWLQGLAAAVGACSGLTQRLRLQNARSKTRASRCADFLQASWNRASRCAGFLQATWTRASRCAGFLQATSTRATRCADVLQATFACAYVVRTFCNRLVGAQRLGGFGCMSLGPGRAVVQAGCKRRRTFLGGKRGGRWIRTCSFVALSGGGRAVGRRDRPGRGPALGGWLLARGSARRCG